MPTPGNLGGNMALQSELCVFHRARECTHQLLMPLWSRDGWQMASVPLKALWVVLSPSSASLWLCRLLFLLSHLSPTYSVSLFLLFPSFKKIFYTIFKGYFPFAVTTKYWLWSPCCTIHPGNLSDDFIISSYIHTLSHWLASDTLN